MLIKLIRQEKTESFTRGELVIDGEVKFITLERPWLDNRENESCIPAREYRCKLINSPRFGEVFEVLNVKDRTHILIHCGNHVSDTHGCILIGMRRGSSQTGTIYESKKAMEEFKKLLGDLKEFDLWIF